MQLLALLLLPYTRWVLSAALRSQHGLAALKDPDSGSIQDDSHDLLWPPIWEPEGLTYNHLPKAGGTAVRQLIWAATSNDYRLEVEDQAIDSNDTQRFLIGSVRNPCDYYVSLYSYGAMGLGPFREHVPKELYKTNSAEHFRRWLRFTLEILGKPSPVGLMTARVLQSYTLQKKPLDYVFKPMQFISAEDMAEYSATLPKFNRSVVDCWVMTEDLVADTKRCLQRYEYVAQDKLDWNHFNELVRTSGRINPSKHDACSTFFDEGSERLVRQTDSLIFSAFGYSSCCEN
mmetsp:Transcript_13001/g.29593  ORF Transcript_13001/g.29593 Transcript_13001/m.29593 type:complete len:288 (+) Transcript_13001:70-933(+)